VAEALGVTPERVRQYAIAGRIPFRTTPGGHRRYDIEAVRAALGHTIERSAAPTLARVVAGAVRKVEPDALIVLFGSRARGDAAAHADWDLLVVLGGRVTTQRRLAVIERADRAGAEADPEAVVSVIVRTQRDWERRDHSPLLRAIAAEGIHV
jgi:uncharacterized protein